MILVLNQNKKKTILAIGINYHLDIVKKKNYEDVRCFFLRQQ